MKEKIYRLLLTQWYFATPQEIAQELNLSLSKVQRCLQTEQCFSRDPDDHRSWRITPGYE